MAKDARRKVLILQIVCVFLALLSLGLLIALIVVSTRDKNGSLENESSSQVNDFCPDNTRLKLQSVRSTGLFNDLTRDEIIAVRDYILSQPSMNVTPYEQAAINMNFIYLIELQQPLKDEALAFLDSNNDALKPERKARVVIFNGGKGNPDVKEYLVSPAAKPTKHEETTGPGQKYPIPFDSRPPGGKDIEVIERIVLNVTKQAFDLLKESFDGYTYSGCTDRCLVWSESAPGQSGHREKWIWFVRKLQGSYVHPVGFEIYLNTQGNDVSLWKVEKVFYYNQSFDSVEELMQGYKNGTLHKVFLPAPSSTSETPLYSSYFQRGKPQPSIPLRPPQLVEPDGKRYTVSGSHVEYMKWSFDFRSRSSTGMQLFDIKFDGERIVYELSLQEAAAFYSGWSPMQMLTEYLDASWGMGSSKFELVPGIDCPSTATFFDTIHFVSSSEPATYRKSVCLFELDLGLPLRRHFDNDFEGGYNFYGGMPGNALVLRSVSTAYDGMYIKGLEASGMDWQNTSTAEILQDHVPSFVLSLFEDRLKGQGLGLHELTVLAATLEHLIHDEAVSRLSVVYQAHSLSEDARVDETRLQELIDTYMTIFLVGKQEVTALTVAEERAAVVAAYPGWYETQKFTMQVRSNLLASKAADPNFAPGNLSFHAATSVVEEIGERYGRWQDAECRDLKRSLTNIEHASTGRVLLKDFYGSALKGNWQFSESIAYLRELGALDESDPSNLAVLIPNYVNSHSNCVASSSVYSVCCINECEGLLSHLEREVAAPQVEPDRLLAIVSDLPSASVKAPRTLSPELKDRLHEVAKKHNGKVPLHGRLFAQWLHHAYPRECPFPHIAGKTNPMTADEWMQNRHEKVSASKQDMLKVVQSDAPVAEIKRELPWTVEEELVIGSTKPASMVVSLLRQVCFFLAAASVCIAFGKDAMAKALTARDGLLLPMAQKQHAC